MGELIVAPLRGCRFVAFADILGFKDLVKANSLFKVTQIVRHVIQKGCVNALLRGADQNVERSLDVRIVSDSIIMWTDSDEPSEFMDLVVAMRFLLAIAFSKGVPLRGSISWGELDLVTNHDDPNVKTESVVGKALVDAYEAESLQEWSGGLVTDDAVRRYTMLVSSGASVERCDATLTIDEMNGMGWLVPFDVPTKNGDRRGEAIGWPSLLNEKVSRGALRDSFANHGKSITPEVEVKIENTIRFIESCGMLNNGTL